MVTAEDVGTRRLVRTMCPMNCYPSFCGMLVEVENGRVVGVRGDAKHPDSRGFLCIRGQAAHEAIENPRRLRTPLRRAGRRGEDRWEPVSWADALDDIAGAMRRAGRERVGLWGCHGVVVNTVGHQLVRRFGRMYGCQWWNSAIVCWSMGGYGFLLTGVLDTHMKEDLAAHANTVILWGSNVASQPTTAPHIVAARRRGARVVTIDVRRGESAGLSDEVILIRPGTDAALALGLMHVIIAENLHDRDFVAAHTVGFEELKVAVQGYSPEAVEAITGVSAGRIRELARLYATNRPATIALGGATLYKRRNGWQVSRAVSCLPALTGQLGIPGGGIGPRHRGAATGALPGDIFNESARPPGRYLPDHMADMARSWRDGEIDVLLLFGANVVSSFADSNGLAAGLSKIGLIVAHDLFLTDTARAWADYVLPGTSWVEEVGVKWTYSQLCLMEPAIAPLWEARSAGEILRELAERLGVAGFYPWANQEGAVDAILTAGGYPTAAELRAAGGIAPLRVSPVAYADGRFPTPSGKVELYSARCLEIGLPPVPIYDEPAETPVSRPDLAARYPLVFRQGRALTHFHSFFENGRALPTLAKADPEPVLWIHPDDAERRGIGQGEQVELFNDRGSSLARARVTADILPGVVWMHSGWPEVNRLTSGEPGLPVAIGAALPIPGGQAAYEALVEVRRR